MMIGPTKEAKITLLITLQCCWHLLYYHVADNSGFRMLFKHNYCDGEFLACCCMIILSCLLMTQLQYAASASILLLSTNNVVYIYICVYIYISLHTNTYVNTHPVRHVHVAIFQNIFIFLNNYVLTYILINIYLYKHGMYEHIHTYSRRGNIRAILPKIQFFQMVISQ